MRSFLFDALFKGTATITPPAPGTEALEERLQHGATAITDRAPNRNS